MKNIIIILTGLLIIIPSITLAKETTSQKLAGRILLQVESRGEAWYVEPKTGERYYMANGNEAYNIMKNLGIGISNTDLEKIKNNKSLAAKQKGKIFLQVESRGEAYYVDFNGNLNYLKNGLEAYNIMRTLGLGISNKDIENIRASKNSSTPLSMSSPASSIVKTAQEKQGQGDSQLKIEKCKSNQAITKSKLTQGYEQTLSLLKSTGNATIEKVYHDCLSKSYESTTFTMGGLSSQISMIGDLCVIQSETTKKQITATIEDAKIKGLANIEQQIQTEYQSCLDK